MGAGIRSGCGRLRGLFTLVCAVGCADDGGAGDAAAPAPENTPICTAETSELGHTPLRRLTRFEYGRTLADLLGADPKVALSLPPDEKSLGFEGIADAYSVSSLHASTYLEVAESLATALVADEGRLSAFATCNPLTDASCVEPFVRAFGRRVFRRPLTSPELSAMLALYEALAGDGVVDGVSGVIAALLQAPQFLYRPEPALGGEDFGPALATRLSYLIVASTPDEVLQNAAESGKLATPGGLLEEADRLVASPRAAEAFQRFIGEWWALDELPTLDKDRSLYRTWTTATPAALAEETRLFVDAAWQAGPTLKLFLDAHFSYADSTLAAFYGLPAVAGSGYQRVELPVAQSAGLLTQGSFLATHAKPNQTSPIHRGKFVRERLFCTPPDPPPPEIVVRPPTVDPRLSTRERFAAHTASPACSGCHALMDPIGFAFENFDAAGRYREVDAGKPVDATGELTDTDVDGPLDGVPSLARRLLESEQVRTCVAKQWFRHAFGRKESESAADACVVQALSAELGESGDLRRVIRSTVEQQLFLEQRPEEAAP
jgi:hypothetical protein